MSLDNIRLREINRHRDHALYESIHEKAQRRQFYRDRK